MKRTPLVTSVLLLAVIGVGWATEQVNASATVRPIVLAGAAATASAAAATYDGVGAGLAAFAVRTRSWFLRAAPAA